MTPEQIESRVIIKILAGSHIHGLNVPESDRDEEAIVIEPLDEAWRLGKPWEDLVIETPELDVKYFSLRKWVMMACNGNPNSLLPLFAPDSHVIHWNALGTQLVEMREHFISKQAIKSHLGYMQGQRTSMLNQIACHGEVGKSGDHGRPRHDLCEKYGYDTKFAMHLLRLAIQGLELASSGRITLPMVDGDRETLLEVRRGEMSLKEVLGWAEFLEGQMKAAFDSSSLPDKPNVAIIEEWMQRIYLRRWSADRAIADRVEDVQLFNLPR